MKITKATVDKMTFERATKAADYRWDDTVKGFGVRVYPPMNGSSRSYRKAMALAQSEA